MKKLTVKHDGFYIDGVKNPLSTQMTRLTVVCSPSNCPEAHLTLVFNEIEVEVADGEMDFEIDFKVVE